MQSYVPASLSRAALIVILAAVSPGIAFPFFRHSNENGGEPSALAAKVTLWPSSTFSAGSRSFCGGNGAGGVGLGDAAADAGDALAPDGFGGAKPGVVAGVSLALVARRGYTIIIVRPSTSVDSTSPNVIGVHSGQTNLGNNSKSGEDLDAG
jgi:hypothetical protein